ncbi:hypothetical protein SeLEV6574_g04134 [Synchytrium endobioticum]|uniref:Intraflagellar transport protein 46 homolog n=1 Tax=Synchytrium endobioticum TaxID=286115 RepID=A0A507CLR7_9FUNG|nr:hypothetical protein SeLEV6574_g07352 [Synchytrium endobioticum]TPX45021.1 hypothetical protein SeLEV6574_g04134 [Synchytrium endobioticum]
MSSMNDRNLDFPFDDDGEQTDDSKSILNHDQPPKPHSASSLPPWKDDHTDDELDFPTHQTAEFDRLRSMPKAKAEPSALSAELRILLGYISEYKIEQVQLEPHLRVFIPEYIPAIGDIDPFLKIPCPDQQLQQDSYIGLTVLDEPSARQSDPKVLDLQLRAYSKAATASNGTSSALDVKSIDGATLESNPRVLDNWVSGVRSLHENKPAQTVTYAKRMPDEEALMQVWPSDVERELIRMVSGHLISADLDLPLHDFCKTVLALMDVPVHASKDGNASNSKGKSRSLIESLHLLFSLYLAFDENQHFGALETGNRFNSLLV